MKDEYGKHHHAKCQIYVLGNLNPHSWKKIRLFCTSFIRLILALPNQPSCWKKYVPKGGTSARPSARPTYPLMRNTSSPHQQEIHSLHPNLTYYSKKHSMVSSVVHTNGMNWPPKHFMISASPSATTLLVFSMVPSKRAYHHFILGSMLTISFTFWPTQQYRWNLNGSSKKKDVQFHGTLTQFLGIKFTTTCHTDGHLSIYLNQPASIEHLLQQAGLDGKNINTVKTPHQSGYPIDKIPKEKGTSEDLQYWQNHFLQTLALLPI